MDRDRNALWKTVGEDEKSIFSLEIPATNCPAWNKILAVVRNSPRESRIRPGERESLEGRRTGSIYATSLAGIEFVFLFFVFFWNIRKSNGEPRNWTPRPPGSTFVSMSLRLVRGRFNA